MLHLSIKSQRMSLLFRVLALGLAGALILLPARRASAAQATGTLAVSATVLSFCTVAATPMAFGNYSSNAASTSTALLTVLCTAGTTYNVGLDNGTGSGATTGARVMTGPSSATLTYALYQDNGYGTLWGNTVNTNTVAGTGTGLLQTLTVYGKVPASQYAAPGLYTDTVQVTVTY